MWRTFLKMELKNNKSIVEFYINSFQERNHEKILSCLTDDVEWQIHGHKSLKGKEAFDAGIENENFEGKPEIKLIRLIEEIILLSQKERFLQNLKTALLF